MQGSTNDFRKGLALLIDGKLYVIVEFQHVKPGKGGAFIRTRLKNVENGLVVEKTFKVGAGVEIVDLEKRKAQFLYREGDTFHFMDLETYEQLQTNEKVIGDAVKFLKDNMEVELSIANGEIVAVELPFFVELEVVETEPGLKGDTVSGGGKPAKLETGATVTVPLFVNIGDVVKIDTRTGEYIERV